MKTMTLNIDIPTGLNVDVHRLKAMATNYVQQYVYMLQNVYQTKKNRKSTAAFRSMRGSLSSNLSYNDMVEEALMEKYKL